MASASVAVAGLAELGARAWNVTGPSVSPFHVVRTWARLERTGCRVLPVPLPVRIAFDDRRAERELGFSARSVEEGLLGVVQPRA